MKHTFDFNVSKILTCTVIPVLSLNLNSFFLLLINAISIYNSNYSISQSIFNTHTFSYSIRWCLPIEQLVTWVTCLVSSSEFSYFEVTSICDNLSLKTIIDLGYRRAFPFLRVDNEGEKRKRDGVMTNTSGLRLVHVYDRYLEAADVVRRIYF